MRKQGLSLIEVLVALVLVAVAVSMFLYFADSLRLTTLSREETQAASFARNYFDSLKSRWQSEIGYENDLELAEDLLLSQTPEGYEAELEVKDEKDSLIFKLSLERASDGSATLTGSVPGSHAAPLRKMYLLLKSNKGKEILLETTISAPAPR